MPSTRSGRARAPRPSLLAPALALLLAVSAGAAVAQDVLVPPGAVWRYLDDGSDQGTAWRAVAFDDAGWAAGPAQLGYGDGDEATVVGYGPDPDAKYITTYFRHAFTVESAPADPYLTLRLLCDDGAVVYLDGAEVARANLPEGDIDYLTPAVSAIGGAAEAGYNTYLVPLGALVLGLNVLAVEVHQVGPTSSDISFDLDLVTGSGDLSLVRKQPYLVPDVDPGTMRVLWQARDTEPGLVEWGLDASCSLGSAETAEYGEEHQHACTLPALAPGLRYHYRVTYAGEVFADSFPAPPAPADARISLLAYGDTRSYPADHDAVASWMLADAETGDPRPCLVLNVGDMVSLGTSEMVWDLELFSPAYPHILRLLGSLPMYTAVGNHEQAGPLFARYFPYQFVGARYWSFDRGPVHVVVVDQYADYSPGSAQLAWIESDLAGTTRPWRFLLLHEPGWSAGGGHDNEVAVQQYLQPLCQQYGVQIVFGGHNHYYARAVVDGVQHVTTGGGGAPLYDPEPDQPYVVASASAYHFCRIDIDGPRLSFAALGEDTVLDTFTIRLPTAVGGRTVPAPLVLERPSPNPANARVELVYRLERPLSVALSIHDLGGRRLAVLEDGPRAAGEHRVVWDGTDAAGRPVPSGTYMARLSGGGKTVMQKLALVR